jgi:hypothetical protein
MTERRRKRRVVWDLSEVEAWIEERRRASEAGRIKAASGPDVRRRTTKPVRQASRPAPLPQPLNLRNWATEYPWLVKSTPLARNSTFKLLDP